MRSGKTILKEAGIVLIVSLMILSTVVIAGDVVIKGDRASPPTQPVISEIVLNQEVWKYEIKFNANPESTIDHYNIYSEIAYDVYEKIGEVDSDGAFHYSYLDINSSPETKGTRYKISAVGDDGQESILSNYHQYCCLTISGGYGSTVGLMWSPYLGRTPSKYGIYRGSAPDNMVLYDTITGSFTSYNDCNVFSVYYYAVKPIFNFTEPDIEITVSGGFGVTAIINNIGTKVLTNLDWTITLYGDNIWFGQTRSGLISSLAPGGSITVRNFPFFGFGEIGIAVKAGNIGVYAKGTAILFFVLGVTIVP